MTGHTRIVCTTCKNVVVSIGSFLSSDDITRHVRSSPLEPGAVHRYQLQIRGSTKDDAAGGPVTEPATWITDMLDADPAFRAKVEAEAARPQGRHHHKND